MSIVEETDGIDSMPKLVKEEPIEEDLLNFM